MCRIGSHRVFWNWFGGNCGIWSKAGLALENFSSQNDSGCCIPLHNPAQSCTSIWRGFPILTLFLTVLEIWECKQKTARYIPTNNPSATWKRKHYPGKKKKLKRNNWSSTSASMPQALAGNAYLTPDYVGVRHRQQQKSFQELSGEFPALLIILRLCRNARAPNGFHPAPAQGKAASQIPIYLPHQHKKRRLLVQPGLI